MKSFVASVAQLGVVSTDNRIIVDGDWTLHDPDGGVNLYVPSHDLEPERAVGVVRCVVSACGRLWAFGEVDEDRELLDRITRRVLVPALELDETTRVSVTTPVLKSTSTSDDITRIDKDVAWRFEGGRVAAVALVPRSAFDTCMFIY